MFRKVRYWWVILITSDKLRRGTVMTRASGTHEEKSWLFLFRCLNHLQKIIGWSCKIKHLAVSAHEQTLSLVFALYLGGTRIEIPSKIFCYCSKVLHSSLSLSATCPACFSFRLHESVHQPFMFSCSRQLIRREHCIRVCGQFPSSPRLHSFTLPKCCDFKTALPRVWLLWNWSLAYSLNHLSFVKSLNF